MKLRAKLDALLLQATESGAIPGVTALLADDQELLYEGAAGRLSVDGDVPFACDTPVRLASMTKLITSVAAMQLVEQGRLHWTTRQRRCAPSSTRCRCWKDSITRASRSCAREGVGDAAPAAQPHRRHGLWKV